MRILIVQLLLVTVSCHSRQTDGDATNAVYVVQTKVAASRSVPLQLARTEAASQDSAASAAPGPLREAVKPSLRAAVSNVITTAMAGREGTNLYTLMMKQKGFPTGRFPTASARTSGCATCVAGRRWRMMRSIFNCRP